jgi:spore maturation protein CgeB
MKNFFLENKHVVYFNSKNDLKKKIDYYLLNTKAAYKIAKNGNQLFIKKHQSKVRIKEFKKIIKSIRI